MGAHYPHFPSVNELMHSIIRTRDQLYCSKDGKFWLLEKFTAELPKLLISANLLPDLVEFYQWLNMNLSHILTREAASKIKIGEIISLAEKNCSKEVGIHVRNLYERVKRNFNQYMKLIDKPPGQNILDDTHLLHLLTGITPKILPNIT